MESNHKISRSVLILPCSTCIGEDLLLDVLKRLPVESLCRFRCVCKRWKSLISSDFFIKLHHSFACSATPPHLKPYLLLTKSQDYSHALCRHRPLETDLVVKPLKLDDLHFPFRTQRDGVFNIVDVIHGVVCVSSFDSTLLWNPAIHKYVALPRLPCRPQHIRGFGYDASKNDFKVVRIWVPYDNEEGSSVSPTYEVYSSQQRQWRTATCGDINIKGGFSSLRGRSRTSCFVNGTIHWLLRNYAGQEYTVLMFDCEREEFTTTILPRLDVGDMNGRSLRCHEAELMEYEGMLSVVVSSCLVGIDYVVEHRVEVWVMEEHGVTASLKRRHQFAYVFDVRNNIDDLDNQPLFHKLFPRDAVHHIRVKGNHKKYEELLNRRVYEESMFLMDDAEAQSYSKQGIVGICPKGMALIGGYRRPVGFELIVPFE